MQDSDLTKLFISTVKSGDGVKISEVFELVYNTYARLAAFVISKYVSDREDIKDITNDVFVKLFNNAEKVSGNLKSYICSVAKNEAVVFVRKNGAVIPVDDVFFSEISSPSSGTFNDRPYGSIMGELKRYLDEESVLIIVLHAVEGMKFRDIGQRLGKSEASVKMAYHRAIGQFKKARSKNEKEYY